MSSVIKSDALLSRSNVKLAFTLSASILLSACGAGGGSESADVTSSNSDSQAPEVVETAPEQVAPVQIFSHPQSITVNSGQVANFSVAASGGGSLNYQWNKNSVAIQGATASSLVINGVSSADAGVYSVVVSNSAGSQTSLSAVLSVNVIQDPVVIPPVVEEPVVEEPVVEEPVVEEPVVEELVVEPLVIVTQPVSQVVEEAASVNLYVEVAGGSNVTFQWLKDGVVVDGAVSSSLSIASASLEDSADYSVVINSAGDISFSDVATLTVNAVEPEVTLKSIALSWDLPQEREDGSALETYEIDGYVIAYGTEENNLNQQINIEGALVLEAIVENLAQGTYYFAIATIDSDGTQGAYSATIQQSI